MIRFRAAMAAGATALSLVSGSAVCAQNLSNREIATGISVLERIIEPGSEESGDLFHVRKDPVGKEDELTRYSGLTESDFRLVAEELGVETAAIKAVVQIEAGNHMKGFWAPGVPVVNFDRKMYSRFRASSSGPGEEGDVPDGLSGYPLREWTQLVNARRTDVRAADMGTFWGMFQIGGFNYRKCGCDDIGEFVRLMSFSELEQLELFAAFITNSGMLPDLRSRNWAAFSRKYNGPGYARRGYHTKMAAAYKRYKVEENKE